MYVVQSVAFYKSEMTMKEAVNFLRRHGYKSEKVDITPNLYRFRQVDPHPLETKGYRFRTQPFPGGFLILAYKGPYGKD